MNNLNQSEINELNSIVEDLKTLHQFVGQPYYHINKTVLEINNRLKKNDNKVIQYRKLREKVNSKKNITEEQRCWDLGLDISSENFVVINQKQELVDFYLKDIYSRIEKIGGYLTQQANILKNILETNTLILDQLKEKENGHCSTNI